MPTILKARAAHDEREDRHVRKVAASRQGPAEWMVHAQLGGRSWDGEAVEASAPALNGRAQTVRRRQHRVDAEGIEGLGDRPNAGRPRRLTIEEDRTRMALGHHPPPGRLVTQDDGTMGAHDEQGEAHWSGNALARAATEAGLPVTRSQLRPILRREGVRWRTTHRWPTPRDTDGGPQGLRSSPTPPSHPKGRRPGAPTTVDR